MTTLNHFYIDTDYLVVNKECICKLNGDHFDQIVENKEFANLLIPFNAILDSSDVKGKYKLPVSTWGSANDDSTFNTEDEDQYCVEFRLLDETYIVPYESVRVIEYDPLGIAS